MLRKILYLTLALIFIQIFSGCTLFDDESEHREGFNGSNLIAPAVPTDSPIALQERPEENESQLPPGFSYNLNWALSDVYALWGGYIWIDLENTGSNDIFVYRYGVVINWTTPPKWYYEERGTHIPVGEEISLGLVNFEGPVNTGEYGYKIAISFLVKDNELQDIYGTESWYDNKTVYGSENNLEVQPLYTTATYKVDYNYRQYFDKIQDKVDFESGNVVGIASSIKAKYPGSYNIYQAIETFDYVLREFNYISDPDGKDVWSKPDETISRCGGDCEDLAILYSSIIGVLGGTTRIYLTETHAFSALYIGNGSTKNSILKAIETFYGTELRFVILEDELGAWLSADTAGGSLYLGGMPADAGPVLISINNYGWYFKDTEKMHAIDVIG